MLYSLAFPITLISIINMTFFVLSLTNTTCDKFLWHDDLTNSPQSVCEPQSYFFSVYFWRRATHSSQSTRLRTT